MISLGKRGESAREEAKKEILRLVSDSKSHNKVEFTKRLVVERKRFSKNTVYKYLKETVKSGLIEKRPGSSEDNFKPLYRITELGLKELERLKLSGSEKLPNFPSGFSSHLS